VRQYWKEKKDRVVDLDVRTEGKAQRSGLNNVLLHSILMEITQKHNDRVAQLTFASVYPHYVTKVSKKGRTEEELQEVISWLTGFDVKKIQALRDENVTFAVFFSTSNTPSQCTPHHRDYLWLSYRRYR
jgi:hypothetical protein